MLAYCKMILEKMSIDSSLFQKELKKAYKMLEPKEVYILRRWVKSYYPNMLQDKLPLYLNA